MLMAITPAALQRAQVNPYMDVPSNIPEHHRDTLQYISNIIIAEQGDRADQAIDTQAVTPCLFMDINKLKEEVDRVHKFLPGVETHYAVKANSLEPVLQLFFDRGCKFDCATAPEMEAVAKVGATGKDMILTHPVRDNDAFDAIKKYQPWAIVVDRPDQLEKLAEATKGYSPVIIIRIKTPGSNLNDFGISVTQEQHVGKVVKADPTPVSDLMQRCWKLGYRDFGFSTHVGTNNIEVARFGWAARLFDEFCKKFDTKLKPYGGSCKVIDIGGGLPDPEFAASNRVDRDKYYMQVGEETSRLIASGYRVINEPGRALVAGAGFAVASVLSYKDVSRPGGILARMRKNVDQPFERRLDIDDSVYGLLGRVWHDGKPNWRPYPIRLTGPFSDKSVYTGIKGRTCDGIDWTTQTDLPSDMQADDLLAYPMSGAYSVVTSSEFNKIKKARVVMFEVDRIGHLVWTITDRNNPQPTGLHELNFNYRPAA